MQIICAKELVGTILLGKWVSDWMSSGSSERTTYVKVSDINGFESIRDENNLKNQIVRSWETSSVRRTVYQFAETD